MLGVRKCPQSHSNTTTSMRGSGCVVGVRKCARKLLSQQQLGIGSVCVLGVRECPRSDSNTTTPRRGARCGVGVRECPRKRLSGEELGIG